jgi:rhodanese-related sulfurtransferase
MKRAIEPLAWVALLALLSGMVLSEGRRRTALEAQVPIEAKELYRTLARGKAALQIVDVRPDLADGYEDARVPGALPMPGCALASAPAAARDRIYPSVPTVIVTASGEPAEAAGCAGFFTSARLLAGGMEGWSDANLPEDSGEYSPPSAKAGGGCL